MPAASLMLMALVVSPTQSASGNIFTQLNGYWTGGGSVSPLKGKGGAVYGRFAGVALEPQIYPDAPNIPHFPSARLDPGEQREQIMRVEFSTL